MTAGGEVRDRRVAIPVDAAVAAVPRILARCVRVVNVSFGVKWSCLALRRSVSHGRYLRRFEIDGRYYAIHRLMLTAKLGRPVKDLALHRCSNDWCVEADHLYEGSRSTAIRYAMARSETAWKAGFGPIVPDVVVEPVEAADWQPSGEWLVPSLLEDG